MEPSLNEVIDEANAHFETGRYKDAAKTLKHIVDRLIKEKNYIDAVYYLYKQLIAWDAIKEREEIADTYFKLGMIGIQQGIQLSMQNVESTPILRSKLQNLNATRKFISKLNSQSTQLDELNKTTTQLMYDVLQSLIDEHDISIDEKIEFLRKIIELSDEIDKGEKSNYEKALATLFKEKGTELLNDQNEFSKEMGLSWLNKSLEIFKRTKSSKEVAEIQGLLKKYN